MLKKITLRRVIVAVAATAMVGIMFASTEADARRGGGGGLRGGGGFSRGGGIRGGGLRGHGLRTASIRRGGIRTAALGNRVDIGRPGRPDLGLPGRPGMGGEATGAAAIGAIAGPGGSARVSSEQGSWERPFLLRIAIPTAAITIIITIATIPRMALATIRIIEAPSTGVTQRTNRFDGRDLAPWPGPYRLMELPGESL